MKMKWLVLALLLCSYDQAFGACHIYFVPALGIGSFLDPRRPVKVDRAAGTIQVGATIYTTSNTFTWSAMDYGFQPVFLIAADLLDTQDTAISSQTDVIKIPDNLDNTIGAALATVRSKLESKNLPSSWITSGMTYRSAVRSLTHMMMFLQRFGALHKITTPLFNGSTITLDTTFGSLSQANRDRLAETAASMSLNTTGVTGATTMRQILKGMADQFANVPIVLGCATI